MKRKYPKLELQGDQHYVYAHIVTTEDGSKKYYVGMSQQQPKQRWNPSQYKGLSLEPFIKQYGWDNIEHQVLAIVNDKHSAEILEDNMIKALQINGLVINRNRSGGRWREKTDELKAELAAYNTAYRATHKDEIAVKKAAYYAEHREEYKAKFAAYNTKHMEELKAYEKRRNSTTERKIYNRVNAFNRLHPDLKVESPLEAKQKYLESNYIPDYIKNDDLN